MGLRTALEQVYGTLRSSFAGRREFVEAFFLKRERGSGSTGDSGATTSSGTAADPAASG